MNTRKLVQYKRDVYHEFKKTKVQKESSALVRKNARRV